MFLDRVNPDNIPDGVGGIDTEKAWMTFFFIMLIFAILEGCYIVYLLFKLNNKKSNSEEKEENKQEK